MKSRFSLKRTALVLTIALTGLAASSALAPGAHAMGDGSVHFNTGGGHGAHAAVICHGGGCPFGRK